MNAIEKFDMNKNCKFSTYAFKVVNYTIMKVIAKKGFLIHLSPNTYNTLKSYIKAKDELTNLFGSIPTDEELSLKLNLPISEIYMLENLSQGLLSLDYISEEFEKEFQEVLQDKTQNIFETSFNNIMKADVANLLKNISFTEREIAVLIYKYYYNKSTPELCKILKLTRQRIFQIESQILEKLRTNKNIMHYAFYMNNVNESLKFIDNFQKNKRKEDNNGKKL